jgi:hypothetical protein
MKLSILIPCFKQRSRDFVLLEACAHQKMHAALERSQSDVGYTGGPASAGFDLRWTRLDRCRDL